VEIKMAVLLFALEPSEEVMVYDRFLGGLKRDELEELLRQHLREKQHG
jgi:hypothetical protein